MKYRFGEKLRKVREKRKATMKEIALMAGVSESLISQIETNKVSPAIDTLLKIAEALEIDIEYLFMDMRKAKTVNIVRSDQRITMIRDGVTYERLSKTVEEDEAHGIEAYFMVIRPGSESGNRDYGHKGKELGIILEGKGEFSIGNDTFKLGKGDSISFASDVPHLLKNNCREPLKAVWVITPPKNFDT
jgi:transcriptional regulator with XRE-family HTH domain